MFNRILVPLDGSTLAERAIPHAELFARIFQSDIILLQVLDPAFSQPDSSACDPLKWQIIKTEAEIYLQGIASQIRKNLGEKPLINNEIETNRVEYCIREGRIAENIVDFAHSENIDLIIISTHGAGGFSRWNINSITQKVVSMIYLPVLIVRSYDLPQINEPIINYNRIMLPIDGSRRAEWAMSIGTELAKWNISLNDQPINPDEKPRILLLTVIRPPEFPIPEPIPLEISQLSEQLVKISYDVVNKYLTELKGRLPVECETRIVVNTSIVSAIHDQAEQENIDLVVFCAHGHSVEFYYPYGSITRNYLDYGSKSVLIIQDTPLSQVKPSLAQIAAEKSGRR
jgi:nucleotide-binding universal stress UspA family protein